MPMKTNLHMNGFELGQIALKTGYILKVTQKWPHNYMACIFVRLEISSFVNFTYPFKSVFEPCGQKLKKN